MSRSYTLTQRWTVRRGPFEEYDISLEIDSSRLNHVNASTASESTLTLINEINEAVLRFELESK